MKIWKRRLIALFVTASVGCLVACGDDDEANNQNQNQNQNQTTNQESPTDEEMDACGDMQADIAADGAPEDPEWEPGDIAFEADYDLLFSDFSFDAGSPGSALNPIIGNYFDQTEEHPIIVLVELEDLDADEGDVMVRGGAGLHADEPGGGEYVWDDELEVPESAEGNIDADGWFDARLPLLNFVATVETESETYKTVIPIRDLDLDAQLRAEEDGSDPHIVEGQLTGVVWYHDAKEVEIVLFEGQDPIPLVNALDTDDINCDHNGDGYGDAWLMQATFDAEQTVIVE